MYISPYWCWYKKSLFSQSCANNSNPSLILSGLFMPSQQVTQSSSVLLQDARSACRVMSLIDDGLMVMWSNDRSLGDSVVS